MTNQERARVAAWAIRQYRESNLTEVIHDMLDVIADPATDSDDRALSENTLMECLGYDFELDASEQFL